MKTTESAKENPAERNPVSFLYGVLRRRGGNPAAVYLRTGASISLIRICAAGLSAVGSIWVARRFGPEKLGISALVGSFVAQAALVLELQQQPILVREYRVTNSEADRESLLQTVQSFRLISGALVVVLFAGACVVVPHPLSYNLALTAFPLLLLARMATPTWIFQARERNIAAAFMAAGQQLFTALTYFIFVRTVSPAGTDLWCQAVAAVIFAAITWLLVRSFSPLKGHNWKWSMAARMRELAWRGRWLFVAGASAYAYSVLEGPLMGYLLSVKELGKYRSAQSLSGLTDLIGVALPTILFPRFIEWRKKGVEHLWARQLKIAGALLMLTIPAGILSLLVVPPMHRLIYGAVYSEASIPAAILVISRLINMLNGVFSWGLIADGGQDKRTALLMVSVAAVSVTLNLTLLPRFGITSAAIVNVVSESTILAGAFLMGRAQIMRLRAAGASR